MLNTYINEWNEARQNATINDERRDENGVIEFQKATMTFVGATIELRITRVHTEGNDVDSPVYSASIFVPKTGVLIESFRESAWPKTEFICTILEAIDPDYHSKMQEALAKRKTIVETFLKQKKDYWTTTLGESNYSEDEVNLIMDHANIVLNTSNFSQADAFIECMIKYQADLFNEEKIQKVFKGKRAGTTDLSSTIFKMICRCCLKRAYFADGVFILSRKSIDLDILDTERDDRIPEFELNAKNVLRQIYADCHKRPNTFQFFAYGFSKLYVAKRNEDLNYYIAKVESNRRRWDGSKRVPYRTTTGSSDDPTLASAFLFATPIKKN